MDISLLDLSLDNSRKKNHQFNALPPDVATVNVNYQPVEAHRTTSENGSPRKAGSPFRIIEDREIREFPKIRKSSVASLDSTQSLSTRDRSRSNASFANEECQTFIQSLKEPKYNKPLTPDEIEWMFQDFYAKMKRDFLSLPVQGDEAERKQYEHEMENMLDRVEKAVSGGELNAKLVHLSDGYDVELNNRLKWFRENEELRQILLAHLELSDIQSVNWDPCCQYLNRICRETSPKAKLQCIIKAHHALVEALGKSTAADHVLPYFIFSLVSSDLENMWQNLFFIKRFRRSSALEGHASYCLTNFEAAISFLETFICTDTPEGVDSSIFAKPITHKNARERSGSQSSRNSVTSATFSSPFNNHLGNRINETFSSYRSMLMTARRPSQVGQLIDQRFLNVDADSLTIGDVRCLLREYKRLAEYVENRR